MLWFKPFVANKKTNLIHVNNPNPGADYYKYIVKISESGKMELYGCYLGVDDQYKLITSNNNVKYNEWNMLVFFCFKYKHIPFI